MTNDEHLENQSAFQAVSEVQYFVFFLYNTY